MLTKTTYSHQTSGSQHTYSLEIAFCDTMTYSIFTQDTWQLFVQNLLIFLVKIQMTQNMKKMFKPWEVLYRQFSISLIATRVARLKHLKSATFSKNLTRVMTNFWVRASLRQKWVLWFQISVSRQPCSGKNNKVFRIGKALVEIYKDATFKQSPTTPSTLFKIKLHLEKLQILVCSVLWTQIKTAS